jgi:hypothetical protein
MQPLFAVVAALLLAGDAAAATPIVQLDALGSGVRVRFAPAGGAITKPPLSALVVDELNCASGYSSDGASCGDGGDSPCRGDGGCVAASVALLGNGSAAVLKHAVKEDAATVAAAVHFDSDGGVAAVSLSNGNVQVVADATTGFITATRISDGAVLLQQGGLVWGAPAAGSRPGSQSVAMTFDGHGPSERVYGMGEHRTGTLNLMPYFKSFQVRASEGSVSECACASYRARVYGLRVLQVCELNACAWFSASPGFASVQLQLRRRRIHPVLHQQRRLRVCLEQSVVRLREPHRERAAVVLERHAER